MDEYNDVIRENVAGFETREDDEKWEQAEVDELAQELQQELTIEQWEDSKSSSENV